MELILRYFPNLTEQQKEQFSQLGQLYNYWNERINVISRKDIDNLYERHILYSLAIAKFFEFIPDTSILDVGTGGGLPGIPLAIIFPSVNFALLDSIGKKILVVNEIIKNLQLQNVNAKLSRLEIVKEKYDFIVSRAFSGYSKFADLTKSKIKPGKLNSFSNGLIYLKGGNFENELKKYKHDAVIYDISKVFHEEFFESKKIIYLPVRG
jgi:16S rRNA (guanine527-N7)-methyltransferase